MSNDRIAKNPETSTEPTNAGLKRRDLLLSASSLAAASALSSFGLTSPAQAQQRSSASDGQRPNIVFIMGDDIGRFNIGAYHQGIMASRTPNLDKLAAEGMRFTDYYAEASCTAGRRRRSSDGPLKGALKKDAMEAAWEGSGRWPSSTTFTFTICATRSAPMPDSPARTRFLCATSSGIATCR